jgi:ribonuclease Z
VKLTILGSSSATPYLDRHPSSQVLNVNDQLYLIDCGEGTLFRLNNFRIKKNKIKAIFISHLHGDHCYGLMGLLTTMSMHEKSDELIIVSPPRLKDIVDLQCEISKTVIRFPIRYIETSMEYSEIYKDSNITVHTVPLCHKIDTCGFIFDKNFPTKRILKEKIEDLKLSPHEVSQIISQGFSVKDGQNVTIESISEDNVTKKAYAYLTDTRVDDSYQIYIQNLDLLYHESTFLHADIKRAEETKHSTAKEAAEVAKAVAAKKLLIGHFSARYIDLMPLLHEAQNIFPNTELAIEGLTFEF